MVPKHELKVSEFNVKLTFDNICIILGSNKTKARFYHSTVVMMPLSTKDFNHCNDIVEA